MFKLENRNVFLAFISDFKKDTLFNDFLQSQYLTIEDFDDRYDLSIDVDVRFLFLDIFRFLQSLPDYRNDFDCVEYVNSYHREKNSAHLVIDLKRTIHFNDYLLECDLLIDSRSYDENIYYISIC